jgi:hypothetical protein
MKSTMLGIASFFLIFITPAGAGDDKPMNAKMEIEQLTLFKNGLGFIVSKTTLPKGATEVRIGQLPIPSFGTFWVAYPKGLALNSLVTSMEDREITAPAQTLGQLLKLNAGRKVTVHTSDRDIEGTVLLGPAAEEPPEAANPYFMGPRVPVDRYNRPTTEILGNEVVMIKTGKGTVAVNAGTILRVEFADEAISRTVTVKLKTPSIRLKLEKPAREEKVTVSYLARGVTWAPGYLVDLSDPKTAKFSAHAVVINETADFKNVKLRLVTGFPNIKFGEIPSPIAKAQTLAEFIATLSGGGQGRTTSGMMTQQVMLNAAADYGDDSRSLAPEYSTAAEGQAAEDLFLYPIADFSLNKDETAWVPLFSADMPYKHIYTWSIADLLDRNNNTYRAGKQAPEEVWHSCRLTNTLSMPLTTAAAEFITDGEFTGQDVCNYTPAKGETTIRINKALNVPAEQAEIEVERKRNAVTIQGYGYDAVKLRGELRIKNKTGKTIGAEITKELSGEVIENAQKAKDTKTAKGLKQVNPKHLLKWEIDLKPGEERVLTYQYQVYIRG